MQVWHRGERLGGDAEEAGRVARHESGVNPRFGRNCHIGRLGNLSGICQRHADIANISESRYDLPMSSAQARSVIIEPDLDAQIGRRVHQLMWDRQITQTAIGERVGMDPSSVAKRLRGKLGWNAAQLKAFAAVLDTSIAYLAGETNNPRPADPDGPDGVREPKLRLHPVEHSAPRPILTLPLTTRKAA